MRFKALILGLILFLIYCSGQYYYEPETNEQAKSLPLNDIAFKILDKRASQPLLGRAGRQYSYTNYQYVVIGDVRPTREEYEIGIANPIFISLLDSIASLTSQPDFVMVLGDLVFRGYEEEYQIYYDLVSEWMESTNIAIFAVPGNHEFLAPNSFEAYEKFIGALNYCFDWKTSTFIILNNCQKPGDPPYKSGVDPQYQIEDFQLNFLSSVLKTAQPLKFVCTHVPYDGTWPMYPGYAEFLDILAKHNVTVSWEAHSHYFKRYWYDGILHIITGGGGASLHGAKMENPPLFFNTKYHFLVVDVKRQRIEIRVYFYQEGYSSEDYNIILDIKKEEKPSLFTHDQKDL